MKRIQVVCLLLLSIIIMSCSQNLSSTEDDNLRNMDKEERNIDFSVPISSHVKDEYISNLDTILDDNIDFDVKYVFDEDSQTLMFSGSNEDILSIIDIAVSDTEENSSRRGFIKRRKYHMDITVYYVDREFSRKNKTYYYTENYRAWNAWDSFCKMVGKTASFTREVNTAFDKWYTHCGSSDHHSGYKTEGWFKDSARTNKTYSPF